MAARSSLSLQRTGSSLHKLKSEKRSIFTYWSLFSYLAATSRRRLPGSSGVGSFWPFCAAATCQIYTCHRCVRLSAPGPVAAHGHMNGRGPQAKRSGRDGAKRKVQEESSRTLGGKIEAPFTCSYEYLFFFMGFSVWYLDFYLYFVILQNS